MYYEKAKSKEFSSGPLVGSQPVNPGDMGSIPDPGRFHMLRSNQASAPQLQKTLCPRAHDLQHCLEKPLHHK